MALDRKTAHPCSRASSLPRRWAAVFPARRDRECQEGPPGDAWWPLLVGLGRKLPRLGAAWTDYAGKGSNAPPLLLIPERPRAGKLQVAAKHTRGNQTWTASRDWRRRTRRSPRPRARGRRGRPGNGRSHPAWAGRAPPRLPTQKGACALPPPRAPGKIKNGGVGSR